MAVNTAVDPLVTTHALATVGRSKTPVSPAIIFRGHGIAGIAKLLA